MLRFLICLMLLTGTVVELFSQTQPYTGPDDPAGDPIWLRQGVMSGNRVLLKFENTTFLSDWPDPDASKWPNAYDGYKMVDGIAQMINARVTVTADSTPVTDPDLAAVLAQKGDLDTLYYCQSHFRAEQDEDPRNGVEWNLQPVPGYCNPAYDSPAMSDNPDSWPPDGWPAPGNGRMWPGEWWGRAGRGRQSADQEAFFVANDAQDQEYLPLNTALGDSGPFYYPRPGKKIGDRNPSVSTQRGAPWGGIGIRVTMRLYQWSNALARDMLFCETTISNSSDYPLRELVFGSVYDMGIGDDGNDDIMSYQAEIDLMVAWDFNGIGTGGRPTGSFGVSLLETPGNPDDLVDNDDDGLVDEKRDNVAVSLVGPEDGIQDLDRFLDYFNMDQDELRVHWDADEDQDWSDGDDADGNGVYAPNEECGDDLGLDGVGPLDINYAGPDADGSESNHKPDCVAGVGCEPNFGWLDISESDQTGVQVADARPVPNHWPPYDYWFRNDQSMWMWSKMDTLLPYFGDPRNLYLALWAEQFVLPRNHEVRVSAVYLHAFESVDDLYEPGHPAPNLVRQKEIAQIIYEQDYQMGWLSEQYEPGNETEVQPPDFALLPNYPNPFNDRTRITFTVNRWSEVEIAVYNLAGRKVQTLLNDSLPSGRYDINWRAEDLASGTYLLSMRAGTFHQVRKMTLLR